MKDSRESRKAFLKDKEKEVRQLENRLRLLQDIDRKLGYVKLENPLRAGWERSYTFIPHVTFRNDYDELLQILDLIQETVVSPNKEFIRKRGKRIKPIEQSPRYINKDKFLSLSRRQQSYFTPILKRVGWLREYHYVWVFNRENWLTFKIKAHYIRKVKLFDEEIDSEITRLMNKLYYRDRLYCRYGKDIPRQRYEGKYDRLTQIEKKLMREEIEGEEE
jgi:hypothetical protein